MTQHQYRRSGLAGIAGSLLFIFVFIFVGVVVGTDASIDAFPDIRSRADGRERPLSRGPRPVDRAVPGPPAHPPRDECDCRFPRQRARHRRDRPPGGWSASARGERADLRPLPRPRCDRRRPGSTRGGLAGQPGHRNHAARHGPDDRARSASSASGVAMLRSPDFGTATRRGSVVLGLVGVAVAVVLLIDPLSPIAAVGFFALIAFNVAVGWKLYGLSRHPAQGATWPAAVTGRSAG